MNTIESHPPISALTLVQSSSLSHLVADSIEEMILGGKLRPGDRLNEVSLAQQFGISRGPLREALSMLEGSGLITQEKNRSAHVRQISLAEAADIYDVRAGLDAAAGRLLAERISDAQLQMLRDLTSAMHRVEQNDIDRFHELNLRFHDTIVAMTGNAVLIDQYRKLCKLLVLFRRRNLMAPMAIPRFAEEHGAIIDFIAQRDGAGSAEALFAHAQGGKARMMKDGEM
jgi:DNA-binding GntR family transcriptional regulator